jgi:hypothetical protein
MLPPCDINGRTGSTQEPQTKQLHIRLWPSWWQGPSIVEQWKETPWWLKVVVVAIIVIAIAGATTIEPSSIPVVGALLGK